MSQPVTTPPVAVGSVQSRDGTPISYRHVGEGPGLVVLHGTMSSAENHVELAMALADAYTVYIPDRRGRGESGPFPAAYGVQTEVEDLDAVLEATGATDVLGVSSGAIIGLEAAAGGSRIRRLAAFEPPLFDNPETPRALLTRFDAEMARGRLAVALVVAMKGAKMGPPIFNLFPDGLLVSMTTLAMRQEDRRPRNGYVPMRSLAPLLHYDLQLVAEANTAEAGFARIDQRVLLLGGSKSPGYLRAALDRLQGMLPNAERVELAGLDHSATWNTDLRGNPGSVADALRRFFVKAG